MRTLNDTSSSLQLGEILKRLGYLTDEQLKIAIEVQKATTLFFGEVLQELNFVTSKEIAEAMALQNNLEYLNIDTVGSSEEALKLVPKHIAEARGILPISLDDSYFSIITSTVDDLHTHDYLAKVSGKKIKLFFGDKKDISRNIDIRYHQLDNPIEAEIEGMVNAALRGDDVDIPHLLKLILDNAIKDRASDIHITPEALATHVFYRIDGVLNHYYAIPSELHQQIVSRVKVISELDISDQRRPQDGSFSEEFFGDIYDFRVSTLPSQYGENCVIRVLPKNISLFNLHSLGFRDEVVNKIESFFSKPYGMILLAGPTGSGKTTTLYSALRKVDSIKKNVMTIEDPIEYKFSFIKQTQVNEQAGYTFSTALKAFMRQDPDVILVGEMRDEITSELAVRASLTGHLVLSTIHANDAAGVIMRLTDLNLRPFLIASSLLAVLAQRLLRKLCPSCKEEIALTPELIKRYGITQRALSKVSKPHICRPVGCQFCGGTGYRGRVAIVEFWEIDETTADMINQEASTVQIMEYARKQGMLTLKEEAQVKVLEGDTSFEEMVRVVK